MPRSSPIPSPRPSSSRSTASKTCCTCRRKAATTARTLWMLRSTDLNMAQVLVQNRVAIAQPVLPDVVKAVGVTVKKRSPDILLVVNLYSETNPTPGKPYYNQLSLSNYATITISDAMARVEGVGDVVLFGQQDYSMRVWVDPDKRAARSLNASDVV